MAVSKAFYEATKEKDAATGADKKKSFKPLRAVALSDIESKPVKWLWQPFLAIGTLNLLEGEEGIGKTFLTCALSCAVASGKGLPFTGEGEHIEPSSVLLISAEDSLSHVLKPRLEAMDAPTERIFVTDEPFSLDDEGIFRLSLLIAETEAKLIIVDPLFSYVGRIKLNDDNEIRSVTDKLKRLAEKHECVIVGIRHIGKSKGFGDARNAGLNGIGWRASARSVLLIGKNPENEAQKAICQTKNNLAPIFPQSIGFEIKDNQFFWTGESSLTKEIMLSAARHETGEEKGERQDAVAFLREVLRGGERTAKDVQAEARTIGISEATLRRAKHALKIQSRKDSFQNGKWFWRLSEDAQYNPEDIQIKKGEHLQATAQIKTSYSNSLPEDAHLPASERLQSKIEHLQGTIGDEENEVCPTCERELSAMPSGELFCEICLYTNPR